MRRIRQAIGLVAIAIVIAGAIFVGNGRTTAASAKTIGRGGHGQNALEFTGTIDQVAGSFTYFGYLTSIRGLDAGELFAVGGEPSEANARLTFLGTAELVRRTVHGEAFNVVADGSLEVFEQASPGANFGNPASFAEGRSIATYTGRWQNILSTLTPDVPAAADESASVDGVGDFKQTDAHPFSTESGRVQIGDGGTRLKFSFHGWGELIDPNVPASHIDIGGRAIHP